MHWTISKKLILGLLLTVIVLATVLTFMNYWSSKNSLIESAQHKMISDLQLGYQYLNEKIPGEWKLEDGVLYKGNVKMNDNFEIVDEIGELTGGNTVTIFLGDTRIATNVQTADGKRAVGTKVSDEVKEVVLNQKKRYVCRADVVGSWNQTAYDPIFDQSGNVIGIWYTGVPEAPYLEIARKAAVNNIIVTVIIGLVIFIFSYVFIKRKINKPLAEMTLRAKKIAEFKLDDKTFQPKGTDEIAQLGRAFNQMKDNLLDMVDQMNQSTQQLSEASTQLTSNSKETEITSGQVAEAVQVIAEGIAKLNEFVQQIVEMTNHSVQQVQEGLEQAAGTLAASKESTQKAHEGDRAIQTAVEH